MFGAAPVGGPLRRNPRTSANGHVTGMPLRSLHARNAVAPGDTLRAARVAWQ
jgi:hypothetical protein